MKSHKVLLIIMRIPRATLTAGLFRGDTGCAVEQRIAMMDLTNNIIIVSVTLSNT